MVLVDEMPPVARMQQIAAEVGYSETAFAVSQKARWRVRYFAPQSEVPFCGHATIALGAALAIKHGDNLFALELNDASITVEGRHEGDSLFAALQSPATQSEAASADLVAEALAIFGYRHDDLDPAIPLALARAGAKHLIIGLRERQRLAEMAYDFAAGREFMNALDLTTVNLVYAETPRLIHSRNAFASGGVYEDPATGAAAAALCGYFRDLGWPHEGSISIIQGEDMGARSRLQASFTDEPGSSIRIAGTVRVI